MPLVVAIISVLLLLASELVCQVLDKVSERSIQDHMNLFKEEDEAQVLFFRIKTHCDALEVNMAIERARKPATTEREIEIEFFGEEFDEWEEDIILPFPECAPEEVPEAYGLKDPWLENKQDLGEGDFEDFFAWNKQQQGA